MEQLNPTINYDLHSAVSDTTSNIVSDVAGGVVASVVDAGASIWNSLPFTPEVETSDLLRGISSNALRVYEENPDTIHAASFIGGAFIPSGIAIKGMNAMRAGMKGVNWFSKSGREADLATVNKLFSEGKGLTTEYRTAVRGMYAKSAVNQAVDTLAAEIAVVGMMNKHPFMEDYVDEPVKNFAISMALGGTLGIGLGHVADRFAIGASTGLIEKTALAHIGEKLRGVTDDMTGAVALQSLRMNNKALTNIIEDGAKNGKNATNDLTVSLAEKFRTEMTLMENKMFENIISADMTKMKIEDKNVFLDLIARKPEMFGVDSISFLPESAFHTKKPLKGKDTTISSKPILSRTALNAGGKVIKKSKDAVFFPNLGKDGGFGSIESAKYYSGAAAIHDTLESTSKTIPKAAHLTPNTDALLELRAKSSAEAQTNWFGWLDRVSNMKPQEFDRAVLSNSDNPAMSAMLYALRTNKELAGKTIKIQDKSNLYKAVMQQQVITTGLAPETYADAVHKVFNKNTLSKSDLYNITTDRSISVEARQMIDGWISGATMPLHVGATLHFSQGYAKNSKSGFLHRAKSPMVENSEKLFAEVYNSASSSRTRAELEKLVDKDGYVYLYRGTVAKQIRGASVLESMTNNYDKALQFARDHGGRVDLYKIHPSDVVATLYDVGSKLDDNTEFIVRATARPAEVTLDSKGMVKYRAQQAAAQASIKPPSDIHAVGEAELARMIRQEKAYEIDSLMASGVPPEAIGIMTNTPLAVVQQYMFGVNKGIGALEDVIDKLKGKVEMDVTTGNAVTNPEQAKALLGVKNKPIKVQGNLLKNPYIEAHAALTNKQMADINDLFTNQLLMSSKSQAVREFGLYMNENATMFKMLNQMLSNANKQLAGTRFFNSFDFYARNMQDLGPAVSAISKVRERISNDMISRAAKPIQNLMSTFIDDPIAVVEFNTFKSLNDSLKGWRMLDNKGFLYTLEDAKDASGKIVKVRKNIQFQGKDYQIKTQKVIDTIKEIEKQSSELRAMQNTVRQIKGEGPINDIGLWLPSFNPMNKYIAYVHNVKEDKTQLLWAKSKEGLQDLVLQYQKHLESNGIKDTNILTNPKDGIKIIEKGTDQEMWSVMNGRMDPITMQVADTSMLKTGSASAAVVPNNLEVFGEIIGGYEHYITAQMRNLTDVSMSDTMFMLDRMSAVNKFHEKSQPLSSVKKWVSSDKDPAQVIKHTLLGDSLLGEYGGWKTANSSFETILMYGNKVFNAAWNTVVTPITKGVFGKSEMDLEKMRKVDYEKFTKEMADRGIVNPWSSFDEALAAKFKVGSLEESTDTSKRIVYAGNALAAAVALRIGELAQPLVNIMSLPILTTLAKSQQTPEIFLGVKKAGGKIPNAVKIMYEGARAANSPNWKHLEQRWEKLGYFTPMISEANETLHMSRSMDKGIIPNIERALDSKIMDIVSKPADVSESFVRRQTMFTGAVLAKHLWPGLDDAGITVFARDFMDKAVGNYHASQRPVFFQGTLGVALGLFQTYMLTLAQSVYRHAELKNYKAIGMAALTQSTIFGTSSLPGFQAVSNMIGENFSDDHIDLTTGTYRALADPMAETLLYGLPSQLGIGTHTRGDINPRFPGLTEDSLVAMNFAKQFAGAVGHVVSQISEADASVPRAVGEALALQSISRPLARGAELAMGYSLTQKGNTIQTPDEVWTFSGLAARILGTRPIEEIKLRDAMHLDSYYGAADFENRAKVIDKVQTRIRGGNLSAEDVSEAAQDYFSNGGTPTGWRSAINNALAYTETSGKAHLLHKLRPDSPINLMIDTMD